MVILLHFLKKGKLLGELNTGITGKRLMGGLDRKHW